MLSILLNHLGLSHKTYQSPNTLGILGEGLDGLHDHQTIASNVRDAIVVDAIQQNVTTTMNKNAVNQTVLMI